MRVFRAALVVAFFVAFSAGPACAEDKRPLRYGEEDKEKTKTEKAGDEAAEQAYQRSLGNIPDKGPTDPWGSVRSNNDAPKASAAKAKKAKTGGIN